ncbi:hypothetical protein CYPRO_0848 [Cyclonatronum proteinivorum]|uniref:Uncharacterized protein n=1 Tax=Cyclonatronum proteinivorum TaxID=1457365 RepID=A0A345UI23_9BACT|nr:hypothetical protein [Cyclonatronum proteinivorum]AXJ00125.1 hypothetical protein CYPRO_0848 [Cyclonatronum proteinivorum]
MLKINRLYDILSSASVKHKAEQWTVYFSFFLFFGHLILIFLRNSFPDNILLSGLNPNYLAALYTPFSIILVYEVYLLILALPLSFSESIRKQYEIISLIIIRRVFKDISNFESFDQIAEQKEAILQIATDLGSGLLLFLLVGVFYHVSLKRKGLAAISDKEITKFITLKKQVSLFLVVVFTSLTFYAAYEFSTAAYRLIFYEVPFSLDLNVIFFVEFYTVMIFADVFIFIASFMFSQTYARLFRNAGFVSSTVILRISLSADPIYGGWIAAVALLTGILSQLIYVYLSKLEQKQTDG